MFEIAKEKVNEISGWLQVRRAEFAIVVTPLPLRERHFEHLESKEH